MRGMESIIEYIKRQLRDAGPRRWASIAALTGCSENTMRKMAYGDRENPTVETIQPLLDYFHAVERGEQTLPEQAPREQAATSEAP